LDLINNEEYNTRKQSIIDEFLGMTTQTKQKSTNYQYYRTVTKIAADGPNDTWSMPIVWTPQVDWLISIFENNMPRSYDDTLPYNGGKSYWKSRNYFVAGAFDYNMTRLPLDDMVAIQERALTHVGLNIYDAGVWGVGLTLSGLGNLVDMYHKNILYTSGSGANPIVGGLKSIRAWEPNPDPEHPPDPFYYGRDKVKNTDLAKVKMPGNVTYIMFKDGCECPSAGCCPQEGVDEIPGNYFYRMIGPTYLMADPLNGFYGSDWRAIPARISWFS
jgi:hypothetical protein